jgi:hypothetical protein
MFQDEEASLTECLTEHSSVLQQEEQQQNYPLLPEGLLGDTEQANGTLSFSSQCAVSNKDHCFDKVC